jgi:curved DNA-binding protein CbpA
VALPKRTHYDTLGVAPSSTPEEIRSAYRKLVLQHHPDRSPDPASTELFIEITRAYEVVSDKTKRFEYDRWLRAEVTRAQQAAAQPKPPGARPPAAKPNVKPTAPRAYAAAPKVSQPTTTGNIAADVTRLSLLFTRGRFSEAETLARAILSRDSRQPIPYAVLGDLARSRGDFPEAAKMYAFAAQMDPRNALYQRRHEELLGSMQVHTTTSRISSNQPINAMPLAFGAGIVVIATVYVILAKEAPMLAGLKIISSWTLGLVAMLFFSGVAVGATLALSSMLDRFQSMATTTIGRFSPTVTLGVIAAINFWAATALYALIGAAGQSFNYSTTRVVSAVAAITLVMTCAAGLSSTLESVQVLLWGGNIAYVGALMGWMVVDAFRH